MNWSSYTRIITLDSGNQIATSDTIQKEWIQAGLVLDVEVTGPMLASSDNGVAQAEIRYASTLDQAKVALAKASIDSRAIAS
jgi:hypothetical protein